MTVVGLKHKIIEEMARIGVISKNSRVFNFDIHNDKNEQLQIERASLDISTTNNLIELWSGNNKYYLCDRHVDERKLIGLIIYKYEYLTGRSLQADIKEEILKSKRIMQIGYLDDFDSLVYLFFKHKDPSIIGLDIKETRFDELKFFIHFAWSEIAAYKRNILSGEWQTFNYNRCRCQELLYARLGIGDFICSTYPVVVRIGEYICYGYLMDEAVGINTLRFESSRNNNCNSAELKKVLNTLNIMDVICYERDHRPGNYNIIFNEKERAVSIQVFDNDSDLCFFPSKSVSKEFVGSSLLIDKDGYIARRQLDEVFLTRLVSVSDSDIVEISAPFLNRIQLKCLMIRLHKVQKAVRRTLERGVEKGQPNSKDYLWVLNNWNESSKDSVLLEQQRIGKLNIIGQRLELWKPQSLTK